MDTDQLVADLRAGKTDWFTIATAADRLQRYEAERAHGQSTINLYNVRELQRQARLIQDATEIFERSGKQNAEAWHKHLGEVGADYTRRHGQDDSNSGYETMTQDGEYTVVG